jgi:hypothetical protein
MLQPPVRVWASKIDAARLCRSCKQSRDSACSGVIYSKNFAKRSAIDTYTRDPVRISVLRDMAVFLSFAGDCRVQLSFYVAPSSAVSKRCFLPAYVPRLFLKRSLLHELGVCWAGVSGRASGAKSITVYSFHGWLVCILPSSKTPKSTPRKPERTWRKLSILVFG